MKEQPGNSERRDFLKAAALGAATAFPGIIAAQTLTNAIKIGLIGCGGRGSGAASQALQADDYGELTAVADIDHAKLRHGGQFTVVVSLHRLCRRSTAAASAAD